MGHERSAESALRILGSVERVSSRILRTCPSDAESAPGHAGLSCERPLIDRKNARLKTLTTKGYNKYVGKYWRPSEMLMVNHQTGKSTRLLFKNYKLQNGLSARDFDRNALKRAR